MKQPKEHLPIHLPLTRVKDGSVNYAVIPTGMSADSYERLLAALELFKPYIVEADPFASIYNEKGGES